ncbi:MAG: hypothetical protein RQ859_04970, partial [Pyrobaculum sp.]|nr:hypothetical protein [Pyrobaculum sp.]
MWPGSGRRRCRKVLLTTERAVLRHAVLYVSKNTSSLCLVFQISVFYFVYHLRYVYVHGADLFA